MPYEDRSGASEPNTSPQDNRFTVRNHPPKRGRPLDPVYDETANREWVEH